MSPTAWHRLANPPEDLYLYRRPVPTTRPIFQGDVFEGVPHGYFKHPHPDAAERRRGRAKPLRDALPVDGERTVADAASIKVGFAILIPHICNYYEGEKGDGNRLRVVARVRKQANETIPADWNGMFTVFPLPNLFGDGVDWLAQLDCLSTVEDAWLAKGSRVACLSFEGWVALMQRSSSYVSRMVAEDLELLADLNRPNWEQVTTDERQAEGAMAEPISEHRQAGDGDPAER